MERGGISQNASLAKSPARTATTQSRRLFASLAASIKLEKLKFARKLNHFALKAKIDWAASKAAWIELGKMKRARGA
ncbi:MAG: hypothetical protein LBT05_00680 [Planctomycetaceae bacterium]|nr:hypothetical protein [Planctomycetaceae bacterium]